MTRPRLIGVNHIGLAPKDPVKARWFFQEALGLPLIGEELVAEQKTLTVMFASQGTEPTDDSPVHATGQRLEVLIPDPSGSGPIGKFLDKKGSGIHHVALTVMGLEALLESLKARGVRLIDETPRLGSHHTKIAFVHPDATGGLLVELVEPLP